MDINLIIIIIVSVFGGVAVIFSMFAIVPQYILLHKTKDSTSISTGMYILYVVGCLVGIVGSIGYFVETDYFYNNPAQSPGRGDNIAYYGVIISCMPTLVLNIFGLIFSFLILYIKVRNLKVTKKLCITERKYAEIKLEKKIKK